MHFNYTLNAADITARTSSQPPVDFEKEARVENIARRYVFPGGLTAQQFDIVTGLRMTTPDDVTAVYSDLVTLNPSLARIPMAMTIGNGALVVHGAASSMNTDDIGFFIETKKNACGEPTARYTHNDASYHTLFCGIVRHIDVVPGWVPAPATLQSIFSQVKNRPAVQEMSAINAFRLQTIEAYRHNNLPRSFPR